LHQKFFRSTCVTAKKAFYSINCFFYLPVGVDKFQYNPKSFPLLTTKGDQAFTFIGTSNFTSVGQLGYKVVKGNLFLYGNLDGNFATSEFELQLSGLTSITAANITL